jgi:hydrogenase-4 component B
VSAILASLAVLGCGAALAAVLGRAPRAGLAAALLAVGVASVLCIGAATLRLTEGTLVAPITLDWPLPLGTARLALDSLSAWFLGAFGILGLAVAPYAWSYLQAEIGHGPVAALGALLCVLLGALILIVTAADAALFLVGWEAVMLSAYFLVLFHHGRPDVRRAAWTYLVANHLATALFVVPLFATLSAAAGTIDFRDFAAAAHNSGPATCVTLFVLGLIGFGTKAGFMPMHVWLPVAHPAAPAPVSALLSGAVIKIGIYGLLRLLSWLPALPPGCAVLMLAFGMASGVLGVLYALAQHEIKRLLAYHSVENIGIIGLGVGMGMLGQSLDQPALTALGYGGALLHVLNHALFKGLLFLSAGAVIHGTGTGDIERLGGLAKRTPINAALFLLAAVSICGLPPLNGFVSEWLTYGALFGGALHAGTTTAGVAALGALSLALMGGLALACFAKVFGVVFLGELREAGLRAERTPALMRAGMTVPALLCVAIGIVPGAFVPLTAGGIGAVAGLSAAECASSMRPILAPAGRLSALAAALMGAMLVVALLRRAALRSVGGVGPSVATWGCGFALPSARMQYTASSFAWPLILSFRQLLWPGRRTVAPAGSFPAHAELETHTPDLAEHDVFAPLFRGIDRCFRMVRTVSWAGRPALEAPRGNAGERIGPLRVIAGGVLRALRRGSVHVYLAFLVLTLLAVFAVESLESPGPPAVEAPATGAPNGVTP